GAIVERLHTQAITCAEQPPFPAVPDGKGEDAVEALQTISPPLHVSVQYYLGVGAGVKEVDHLALIVSQLDVIVDFFAECDQIAARWIGHSLDTSGRKIDDGETSVRKSSERRACRCHDVLFTQRIEQQMLSIGKKKDHALSVWTAVRLGCGHAQQTRGI